MFSPSAPFSATSVISLDENIIMRKNRDGSIVVMSMADEDLFYKITGVAADIFGKFDGKKNIGEIITDTQEQYEVSLDQISQDTEDFMKKLLDFKIIIVK